MAPPRDPATAERDLDPADRVNNVSKTPRFAPETSFTATAGSFGLRRGEIDLTGPLSDTLAGRLVVAGETSSGWRDHVGLDRTVVAPFQTWRPNDALHLIYVGEFTAFTTLFDRGQPFLNGALALPPSRYFASSATGRPASATHVTSSPANTA